MSLTSPSWPKAWPKAVIVGLATLGPVGRKLPAPGTWGSAVGMLYFMAAVRPLGLGWAVLLSAIGAYLAVAVCGEAELRLAKKDPGEVILDEFVVMPFCFLGWPVLIEVWPAWVVGLAGFGLFRLFDILKPFGISRLQALPGGWGVVADDVAAALVTCAVLHGSTATWVWAHSARTWR